MVGRATHGTLEQMRNLVLQDATGAQPDRVEIVLSFQHLVEVWNGKGRIGPEEPHQATIRVSRDDRLQNRVPSFRAVHIAGPQGAAFEVTELVEHEQGVIAHAAKMAVPCSPFLRAVGRTDRTQERSRGQTQWPMCPVRVPAGPDQLGIVPISALTGAPG